MKLNAKTSDIARQLVIANSYLAHYKGSAKAVKMLLNMLGFNCIAYEGSFPQLRVFFDAGISAIKTALTTAGFSGSDLSYSLTKKISITDADGVITDSNVTLSVTIPNEASYSEYPFIDIKVTSIANTNMSDSMKISAGLNMIDYAIEALKTAIAVYNQEVFDVESSNTIKIVLMNADHYKISLEAKQILAQQLQEILPINKIVTSDTIFGFTRGTVS